MQTELVDEIILILGEKKILQMHNLIGRVPLSFAMLVKVLRKRLWASNLKVTKFNTVGVFAKKHGISKSTVYRALKKLRKK
jgi:DNA-binding transcriptional ArsR family regulator